MAVTELLKGAWDSVSRFTNQVTVLYLYALITQIKVLVTVLSKSRLAFKVS